MEYKKPDIFSLKGTNITPYFPEKIEEYRPTLRKIIKRVPKPKTLKIKNKERNSVHYDIIYDRKKRNYKKRIKDANNKFFPLWNLVINIFLLTNSKYIVDLGCGDGLFIRYLYNNFKNYNILKYWGYDFSSVCLEMARNNVPDSLFQFEKKDITKINLINKPKNTLYLLLNVLGHINDDIGVLEKIPENNYVCFCVSNYLTLNKVRFFKTEKDILLRYQHLFKDKLLIKEFIYKNNETYFLCYGKIISFNKTQIH
jgi:SAM-dependent methyltransferase